MLQDEGYDEVFTVSASSDTSHYQSDSDSAPEVVNSPTPYATSSLNSPTPYITSSLNSPTPYITSSLTSATPLNTRTTASSYATTQLNTGLPSNGLAFPIKGPTCLSKPSVSLSTTTTTKPSITSRSKTPTVLLDSRDQTQSSRTNSRTADRSSKSSEQDDSGYNLTLSKRLSRSCDSLDTSAGKIAGEDFGTNQSEGNQKGKLKPHRRKGRRAVTLHNLDTKQLMLILNLQMRYLEETKTYQSQKDIQTTSSARRAITPQPSSHQPKIPQNIRSHTPQPYRRQNVRVSEQEREFYDQVNSLLNSHDRRSESVINEPGQKRQQKYNINNTVPNRESVYNPYIYSTRGSSVDNIHYVTYSDKMLNLKGPKPKSRATVKDYFLPPEPIQRHTRNTLPPQPIRRQRSTDQPSEPSHRGKSAFHIVDCARNTSNSSSISSEPSDEIVSSGNTSSERKSGKSDYAEVAIRDNFRLNQSPYMFEHTHSRRAPNEHKTPAKFTEMSSKSMKNYMCSEIPPPYTGPPSYVDFVSSCENSVTSSTSSNQEEIYSRPIRRNTGQNTVDDKYSFEIENKSLLRSERDKNYNVRQPNLDSVYGYTETLNDVQNCHGDIKVRKEANSVARLDQGLVRESIYSNPAKSKVKQCIVPEDYYTPIHKVSRRAPVYANTNSNDDRKKTSKHEPSKLHSQSPNVPNNSSKFEVSERERLSIVHGDKFSGYMYPDSNQIAPDAKYHDYEDVYDGPEHEEPILMSYKEIEDLRNSNENSNGGFQPPVRKGSPKKNKIKPYKRLDNNHKTFSDQSNQQVDKSQTFEKVVHKSSNVPSIQVNDNDVTEDDVFIVDRVFENEQTMQNNGHRHQNNAEIRSTDTHSAEKQTLVNHGARTDHVTSLMANHNLETAREVPDGTENDIIDNSSEEECAETGV